MITTNLNLESGHESGQLNNSLESLICSQLIDQHYHTSFKSGSEYSNDFNLTVEPVTDCFKLLSSSPPSIQSHHQSSLGLMRQGSIPAYQNTESQPWMIDILSAQCHIRPFSSDSSVQPLEPESQLTINPSLIDPSGQSPYPQNILCHQKYRCDWPTSCCCCCSTDNSSETSSSILHPNLISPILGTQLGTGKEPFHSDPSRPDLSSFVPQNPVELDPRSVRLESPMDCHQSDDNEVRYKDWIELDYQETERIDDTFQAEPSSVSDSTSPLSPSSSRKTSSSTDTKDKDQDKETKRILREKPISSL
ncbi:expressed protein [Phakopsora pachyrhizi]|uniref:Expressed protein n=1 Tax=Phakopsora pachyrhizi TaxID=170000 RepID=A0AAV0B976_PHAPC|nr:expressed protein [Phakopsora pachyrhizi]